MAAVFSHGYSHLDSVLQAARALRSRTQLNAALAALEGLKASYPGSGRLQQELAHVHLAHGAQEAALVAYQQAVDRNDALPESWSALARLRRQRGEHVQAAEAERRAGLLACQPAEVVSAASLAAEGELIPAEQLVRQYLRQHGAHVEAMRVLARICMKLHVLDDAELLLENIARMSPDYLEARFEYACVLVQRRRHEPALAEVLHLLEADPGSPVYRRMQALINEGLGRSEEALRIYQQLSLETPEDSELRVSMAQILKTRGEAADAIELLKNASRTAASFASASLVLSNIGSYRFSDEEITQMKRIEASGQISLAERYQLCFTLGKVLEQRALYEESFGYYARGNTLKRSELPVDPETLIQTMRRQPLTCTADFFAARRGFGCSRPDPIFIVGMPRAGSTLLEQILATHPQIDGTLELPDIPRLVHRFRNRQASSPPRYPAILADLNAEECRLLGEEYLEATRVHRENAPFFIDKLPNNFRDIGFIQLILPNARIIDARREAMACCFGNFKQLFHAGMEFKYSLDDLGRYYSHYTWLMEHWSRVLPGKILRVDYENVVNDLESSVRRMLEFLGLPFEPACLEFYKTQRTVRTLSSQQVRRPINREGLDHWRHFEPWLGPLKGALQRGSDDAASVRA